MTIFLNLVNTNFYDNYLVNIDFQISNGKIFNAAWFFKLFPGLLLKILSYAYFAITSYSFFFLYLLPISEILNL